MKKILKISSLILSMLIIIPVFSFNVFANEYSNIKGDCNLDGKIDSRDPLLILKFCATIVELSPQQKSQGDFDNNGKLNTLDALGILKYIVFGGQQPPDENIIFPEKIVINHNNSEIFVGDEFIIDYFILPSNTTEKSLSFNSSNKNIAIIDDKGKITALSSGFVTITIAASNGIQSEIVIEIKEKNNTILPEQLYLNFEKINIFKGENINIISTIYPENVTNKKLIFSSNNENIASIDENGKITAKSIGIAEITVKTINNIEQKAFIYVNEKNFSLPNGEFILKLFEKDLAMSIGNKKPANMTNVFLQTVDTDNYNSYAFNISQTNGIHTFSQKQDSSMVIDVYRTVYNLEIGQNIDIYKNNDPDAQKFNVTKLYNGSYAISLNAVENSAIAAISAENGANIFLGELDYQNPLIQWKLETKQEQSEKRYYANVFNTDGQGLNIRKEPNSTSGKIGFLYEGQTITVIGEKSQDWYKILFKNSNGEEIIGYCHGDYIKISDEIIDSDNNPDDDNTSYYLSMLGKQLANIGEHGNHTIFYKHPENILDPSYCGQCTWYAYGRFNELTSIKLKTAYNAKLWLSANKTDTRLIVSENKYDIASKSIAISTYGTYGHVMIIEHVQRDSSGNPVKIFFTEANWGPSYNDKYDNLDGLLQVMNFNDFITKRNISGYIKKK